MPVEVSWMYSNRVIKVHQYGKVSSHQIVDAIAEAREMMKQGIAPVHTIVDGLDVEGKPDVALGDMRKLIPTIHETTGWMIVMQNRTMDRFFTSVGMQIAGIRYKFAPDEKSALKILLECDPTLIDVIR